MFCVHFPTEMARQGSVKAEFFCPVICLLPRLTKRTPYSIYFSSHLDISSIETETEEKLVKAEEISNGSKIIEK